MSTNHTNNPPNLNHGPQSNPTESAENATNSSGTNTDLLQQAMLDANVVETSESDSDTDSDGAETQSSQRPTCPICGQSFSEAKSIYGHIFVIHTDYVEYGSEGRFVKKDTLDPNDETPRGNPFLFKKVSDYLKPARCTICAFPYKTAGELRKHVRKCHPESFEIRKWVFVLISDLPPDKQDIVAKISERPIFLKTWKTRNYLKIFKCSKCDVSYASRNGLKYHMKTKHGGYDGTRKTFVVEDVNVDKDQSQEAYEFDGDNQTDGLSGNEPSFPFPIFQNRNPENPPNSSFFDQSSKTIPHITSTPHNIPPRSSTSLPRASSSTSAVSSVNISAVPAPTSSTQKASITGDEELDELFQIMAAPTFDGTYDNDGALPESNNMAFENSHEARDRDDYGTRDDGSTFTFPMSPKFNADTAPLTTPSRTGDDSSYGTFIEESPYPNDNTVVANSNYPSYDIQPGDRNSGARRSSTMSSFPSHPSRQLNYSQESQQPGQHYGLPPVHDMCGAQTSQQTHGALSVPYIEGVTTNTHTLGTQNMQQMSSVESNSRESLLVQPDNQIQDILPSAQMHNDQQHNIMQSRNPMDQIDWMHPRYYQPVSQISGSRKRIHTDTDDTEAYVTEHKHKRPNFKGEDRLSQNTTLVATTLPRASSSTTIESSVIIPNVSEPTSSTLNAPNSEMPTNMKKSTGKFSCTLCDKSYKYKNGLQQHISSIHHEDPNDPTTLPKRFYCTICNVPFTRADSLRRHNRRSHMGANDPTQPPPLTCTICNYHFKKSGHLNMHMRTTHGNFTCTICDKSFPTYPYLRRHNRVIHGDKDPLMESDSDN